MASSSSQVIQNLNNLIINAILNINRISAMWQYKHDGACVGVIFTNYVAKHWLRSNGMTLLSCNRVLLNHYLVHNVAVHRIES
jgi:hypothetical protein